MSGGLGALRLAVIACGLAASVAGLATIALGRGGALTGMWLVGLGLALVVGTLLERVRYRSDASDRSGVQVGPGGGEPLGTRLAPRFRRSDEAFIDPTSGHRMRVWTDPSSGERRYVTEE